MTTLLKIRTAALLAALTLSVPAALAQDDAAQDDAAQAEPAAEAPADLPFDTDAQRMSFALGQSIGRSVAQQFTDVDADLDRQLFLDGLQAGIDGSQETMTPEQAMQSMIAYQSNKNIAAAEAFLAENAEKDGVEVLDSGLQIKVEEAGEDPKPAGTDVVTVHYRGTLVDGTPFDSSYDRGQPAQFPLDGVIPGFKEGLMQLGTGGKAIIYVPPALGYADSPAGPGGPNAMLIFDVELMGINEEPPAGLGGPGQMSPEELQAMLQQMQEQGGAPVEVEPELEPLGD